MKTKKSIRSKWSVARAAFIAFVASTLGLSSFAQLSLSTVPPLNGGNGAGGISFNVTAENAVVVTGLSCSIYGTASGPFEIWYNPVAISGAPSVTTTNGWVLAATGTVTPGGTATTNNPPVVLPASINVPMPAGSTYGWFINTFSASPNCAYTTWNASNQQTFTDGNITIFTGTNVGYGGPGPNPTNHPRQFNGVVSYTLASQAPNDGGVVDILEPISYCSNETVPLVAHIRNFGTEQLDSCMVVWDVNGLLDSAWFNVMLDTFNGAGNIDTILFIDSIMPGTGALNLQVYTKWPNGVADTVNANDTAAIFIASPALSGTYVIGSSTNADFANFTAAAAALNSAGVCGPVVMEAESGTYDEQWTLDEILGASGINTITFISQSGDSSDVVLTTSTASATTPSIVTLNGSDWIRFHQLGFANTSATYDQAISLNGGSDSIIISNCHLVGNYASTVTNAAILYSNTSLDNGLVVHNNRFVGGGYAAYIYGSGTASLENGLQFTNNKLIDQYYHALRLYYQNAPIVRGNYVTSTSSYTSGAGFYLVYCDNLMEVSNNHIVTDPSSSSNWPLYGIYLSSSDGAGIANAGRIFNNRIVVGADTNTPSTSTFYGIYMTASNAQRIVNNTVTVLSGGTAARALYQTTSDLVYFKNNLFTAYSSGHAAYYNSGIAVEIDRNNYYAPNGTEIYYAGMNYQVEAFTAATGYDVHSKSVDPMWSDLIEGFLCNDELDGLASPIAFIPADYSGFLRGVHPDPGAVEFVAVNAFTLGNGDTLCGNNFVLEVSGAATVSWSVNGTVTNANSVAISTTATTPQTYNVLVALASNTGCGSASDNAIYVLVPNASLDSNTHLCADETATLNPGGSLGGTYSWTPNGATTQAIQVASPGVYTVTKNEYGCVSTANTVVTKSQAVAVLDVEICDDDMPYTADATIPNGQSYAWSGGNTPTSASNVFDQGGTYQVTVSDLFGCISEDTLELVVIDEPIASISHTHVSNYFSFSSAASTSVGSNATYLWDFGDGNSSTLANPQHAYAWSGNLVNYTVTLFITNDCGTDQATTVVGVDPLGVAGIENGSVVVYPNPARDYLNIVASQTLTDAHISIVDLAGRVVYAAAVPQLSQAQIALSGLAKGSYSVRITSESYSITKPIVIE